MYDMNKYKINVQAAYRRELVLQRKNSSLAVKKAIYYTSTRT